MAIVGATMQIGFWSIILPVVILVAMQLFKAAFYCIGIMLFWIIDLLQSIFRKLAGLEDMWLDGQATSGDILTSILKSQVVVDTLISVTIFAVALVIIATIVQMIRTEYTTEGSKNSKEGIIGKGLKSLVMFVLIPVVCFFGIRTSNYLLKAVDSATSGGGSATISGSIFLAAATGANRLSSKELENDFAIDEITITSLLGSMFPSEFSRAMYDKDNNCVKGFGDRFKTNATSEEKARADLSRKIDSALSLPTDKAEDFPSGICSGKMSYMNASAVNYFYSYGNINMIVLFVGCYLVLTSLFNAALGMIVRLYKCTVLFIIAPAAIGLQPLDDGNAYKKWRGQFISNVLSAYGVIVGLNLFFVVSGIVSKIELWDPSNFALNTLNRFMQAFFIVAGATQLKAIAKMIGDLIGAADAMSEGEGVAKGVTGIVQGMGNMAGGAAKFGAGVVGKIKETAAAGKARTASLELKRLEAGKGNYKGLSDEEKEAKRSELTGKIERAESARQIERNRNKALFESTHVGGMLNSLTGGVKSVMNGSWAKEADEKSIESLKSQGYDTSYASSYVKKQNNAGESVGKTAGLAVATGGLSLVGSLIGAITEAIKGGKSGGFKGAMKGMVGGIASGATFLNDVADASFGDGDEGTTAKREAKRFTMSTAKTNAAATVDEQANARRQILDDQKQATMNAAEKKYGKNTLTKYYKAKEEAGNIIGDLQGSFGSAGSTLDAPALSRLLNLATELRDKSQAGSETYKSMDKLLGLIGSGSDALGGSDRERGIHAILSGLDKDFLSREVGAMQGVKSRDVMQSIHAGKLETDNLQTSAHTDINNATLGDDRALSSVVEKFTKDMSKGSESNADVLRDAIEYALASGLTIRGTDGKPLEVNSKAFVDAIKELKRATEETNSKREEKEMAKTLKDMLKALKKKN